MIQLEKMNMDYAEARIDIVRASGYTKTLYSTEHAINSISIRTGAYDGNAVGVGSVYEIQCSVVMEEMQGITAGTMLVLSYNIGGRGWKPFGTFYVSETPEYSGDRMSVGAHGKISANGGKIYTNQDFYLLDKITTVGEVLDSLAEYGITVKYDKTSAFARWQILAPKYNADSQESQWKNGKITVKELLAGIATLFGGNMVERNNVIYLISKNGDEGGNFNVDDATSYQHSRETYGLDAIALSHLPWTEGTVTDFDNPDRILEKFIMYMGTERQGRNILVSQADTGANIKYTQNIECDWVGHDMSYCGGCFIQGDLVYNTGTFTFPGYNDKLHAGNVINIYFDENKYIPFVIGEMVLKWDGGFTTEISCQCSVDAGTGVCTSSTSSTATASRNEANALMQYNNTIYADVLLANVAEISEAFIGKLTSDEIFAEKLTANEAFIENLTANTAFIETLTSDEIFVQQLTAGDVFAESLAANEAFVEEMKAKVINADTIEAAVASVGYLTAEKADIQYAKIDFANVREGVITNALIANAEISFEKVDNSFVRSLNADQVFIEGLRANTASFGYLNAEAADVRYAAINFANIDTADIDKTKIGLLFNEVGLIDRATIVDGHVTGFLDAVQINANSITAGEVATDRLIIRGSTNSIVYELNNITGALQASSVDTLNGEVITKRTISADKLIAKSITANEIDVQNLFAQDIIASGTITGATLYGTHAEITSGKIGAFSISNESLVYDGSNPYRTVTISDLGVIVGYDYALTKTAITSGDVKVSCTDNLYAILGNRNRGNTSGPESISLFFEYGVNASYSGPGGSKTGKQYRSAELSTAGIIVKDYTNWDDGSVDYNGADFDIQASVLGLRADAGSSPDTAIHGEGNLRISAQKNILIDRPLECTSGIVSNGYTSKGSMELFHPQGTPYIDFHHGAYGTEGSDFTSRIIEYSPGTLTFEKNGSAWATINAELNGLSSGIRDVKNGRKTYMNYASDCVTDFTYFAVWNPDSPNKGDVELRAYNKANVASAIGASKTQWYNGTISAKSGVTKAYGTACENSNGRGWLNAGFNRFSILANTWTTLGTTSRAPSTTVRANVVISASDGFVCPGTERTCATVNAAGEIAIKSPISVTVTSTDCVYVNCVW